MKSAAPATGTTPATAAKGPLCANGAITLRSTTATATYALGQQPTLGVTVTNAGTQACVRDLSGPLQVFTVYTSAGERIWSNQDCAPAKGSDVRLLSPGERVQYSAHWTGMTSSPGCKSAAAKAPVGRYVLSVSIGTLNSAPVDFSVVA